MPLHKVQQRQARKRRIRAKVSGTAARPRLCVFRSLTQISAQLIDDTSGKTIAAASTKELKKKGDIAGATELGKTIAKKAKDAKIDSVVFDRGGNRYHGRMKALADAARDGGLTF